MAMPIEAAPLRSDGWNVIILNAESNIVNFYILLWFKAKEKMNKALQSETKDKVRIYTLIPT